MRGHCPGPRGAPPVIQGMTSILVIKLGALGDILLAEGALRDIRVAHPGAHIAVLTRRAFVPLLSRCPWVDRVIADDSAPRWRLDQMWALGRRLAVEGIGRVYDLQNSRRSRFYRRWLLRKVPASAIDRGCALPFVHPDPLSLPVPERHAGQLRDAGMEVRHAERPFPDWMRADVDALLAGASIEAPFLVLLPGASKRHAGKRWPHYAELSRRVHDCGLRVVTIPGPDEADLGLGYAGCVLRVGARPLDLFELAGVLDRAAFVIGNDSGPTHLAALLDRPGLALFGSDHADPRITGMDRRRLQVLQAPDVAGIGLATVLQAVPSELV
jgi:ADP-heptose:LPS heptosyltransferase